MVLLLVLPSQEGLNTSRGWNLERDSRIAMCCSSLHASDGNDRNKHVCTFQGQSEIGKDGRLTVMEVLDCREKTEF